MSHVPKVLLHVYQGEHWSLGIEMSGDDAPANFDSDEFYMEIRELSGDLVERFTVGDGITVTAGQPKAQVEMAPAKTRAIPSGDYQADLFWVSDSTPKPLFSASVEVTRRVTVVEAS